MRIRLALLGLALLPFVVIPALYANMRIAEGTLLIAFPMKAFYRLGLDAALISTLLAIVLVSAAVFSSSIRKALFAVARGLRRQLGPLALIAAIVLMLFVQQQGVGPVWLGLSLALAVCMGAFIAPRRVRLRIARRIGAMGRALAQCSSRSIALGIAAAALPILLAVKFLLYHDAPMTGDGASALFQAVLLAHGRFVLQVGEFGDFYNGTGMLFDNGVYSMYPPGNPLLLAVGEFFHAAWLVGPLLGGATAALVFLIGERWFGRLAGILAAALLIASPHFIAMMPTYMSHVAAAFYLTLMLYLALVRREARAGAWIGAGVGLAAGMAFVSRPLTALAIGAPVGVMFLVRQRRNGRGLAGAALGAAVVALFLLYYNAHTTGDPFLSGYQAAGANHRLGFGGITAHTPGKAFFNGLNNLWEFSQWAPGALPSAYFWLGLWVLVGPFTWRELTLAAMWALLPASYFFYYYQDFSVGPRFLFEAVVPGALLSAQGIVTGCRRLAAALGRPEGQLGRRLAAFAGTAVILGSLVLSHELTPTVHGVIPNTRYMHWRRHFTDNPRMVVFVSTDRLSTGLAETARHPEGPLFLCDLGPERNRQFMAAHPDRIYYYGSEILTVPYADVLAWLEQQPQPD